MSSCHNDLASISFVLKNRMETDEFGDEQINVWRNSIFSQYPNLQQLYNKWSQRAKNDLKVPPGSQSISLSYDDPRYMLSIICILMSKRKLLERSFSQCERLLRESYMWCPKSAETLFLLAEIIRLTSFQVDSLEEAVLIYRKAIVAASAIINKEVSGDADVLLKQASFGKEAACKEALYLLQSNNTSDADKILRTMGYEWRISDKVLNYMSADNAEIALNHTPLVKVFDNFLPSDCLSRMQHIFRSESCFWKEHDYDEIENFSRKVGYFSYLYPFRERPAKHFVEQIIDGIYETMVKEIPDLVEATTCKLYEISLLDYLSSIYLTNTTAEWWVHSRPHGCGHQMHFDSDETRIDEGKSPQHPIISCVLFVREAGGPTLMTDQTLKGNLATEGWMIDAKLNRVLAFDAKYLHGVVPGIGESSEEGSRRLTFMVGFWRKIEAKDKGRGRYGAGQPYPFEDETLSWPKDMTIDPAYASLQFNSSQPCRNVRYVAPVWEKLQNGDSNDYKTFFQGF